MAFKKNKTADQQIEESVNEPVEEPKRKCSRAKKLVIAAGVTAVALGAGHFFVRVPQGQAIAKHVKVAVTTYAPKAVSYVKTVVPATFNAAREAIPVAVEAKIVEAQTAAKEIPVDLIVRNLPDSWPVSQEVTAKAIKYGMKLAEGQAVAIPEIHIHAA